MKMYSCKKCSMNFVRKYKYVKHKKICEQSYKCLKCHKTYKYKQSLANHKCIKCEKCKTNFCNGKKKLCNRCMKVFSCTKCKKQFVNRVTLNAHIYKSHNNNKYRNIGMYMKRNKEYTCHKCMLKFKNRSLFYNHKMLSHYGGKPSPLPQKMLEDMTNDKQLEKIININKPHIIAPDQIGNVKSTYNFPTSNLKDYDTNTFSEQLNQIYQGQNHSFKTNISLGIVLRNIKNGKLRYFIPYTNEQLFKNPITVSNPKSLKKLIDQINQMDLQEIMSQNRPSSAWSPYYLTNISYSVYPLNYQLGVADHILPKHIMNKAKHDILQLNITNPITRRRYKDKKCFFRCLTLHKHKSVKSKIVNEYFNKWKKNSGNKHWSGITLDKIPKLETVFKVDINIYQLKESNNATCVYRSEGMYSDALNIDLYKQHCSYIKNFKLYCKKFECLLCHRLFKQSRYLKQHYKHCYKKDKHVFNGGYYNKFENIFQELESFNIYVPQSERINEHFIFWDFESMLIPKNYNSSEKVKIVNEHIPICVALASSLNPYRKAYVIFNKKPQKLVRNMMIYMDEVRQAIVMSYRRRWASVFTSLNNQIQNEESKECVNQLKYGALKSIYKKFDKYVNQVTSLGFNSKKYDLMLIQKYILKELNLAQDEDAYIIKKGNTYMCIANSNYRFLDVISYLTPSTSYSKFLKTFNPDGEQKGFFPYEKLISYETLKYDKMPDYDDFYSSVKKANVLGPQSNGNYEYMKNIWKKNNMKSLKDLLIWYVELDVNPAIPAIEKMQEYYTQRNISPFKDGISIAGLAKILMFQDTQNNFALFSNKNANVFHALKGSITGGPSIVFKREAVKGQSNIKNNTQEICQRCEGHDLSSLYPFSFSHFVPCEQPIIRRKENGFRPELDDIYMKMYLFIDFLSDELKVNITHKLKGAEDKVIYGFRTDGYCQELDLAVLFHGCYYHSHDPEICPITRKITSETWIKNQNKNYKRTMNINKLFEKSFNQFKFIWECEYNEKYSSRCKKYQDQYVPAFYLKNKGKLTQNKIRQAIFNNEIFGFAQVSLNVPESWDSPLVMKIPPMAESMTPEQYFSQMAPIFLKTKIQFSDISPLMQEYIVDNNLSKAPRRQLVGGLRCEKTIFNTNLIRYYLNLGMELTETFMLIEYTPKISFDKFVSDTKNERIKAAKNPNLSIVANMKKLILNSAYGQLLLSRDKHSNIYYTDDEAKAKMKINQPTFKNVEVINKDLYELTMSKSKIINNNLVQIAAYILSEAKLSLLSIYYDFFLKFLQYKKWEMVFCDTDSCYITMSGQGFRDILKPNMVEEYDRQLTGMCNNNKSQGPRDGYFIVRECCEEHRLSDFYTPGKLKLECSASSCFALNSKCYILTDDIDQIVKFASKGVNLDKVTNSLAKFKSVLKDKKPISITNTSIGVVKSKMTTYEQTKTAFSFLYVKRWVLADGLNTKPLSITLKDTVDLKPYYVYNENDILGNNFKSKLSCRGLNFTCVNHMFYYIKAEYHKKNNICLQIKNTTDMFKINQIIKTINTCSQWYNDQEQVMENILTEKLKQNDQIKNVLIQNKDKIFIYNSQDLHFGIGLDKNMIDIVDPIKYPGRNVLSDLWVKISKSVGVQ